MLTIAEFQDAIKVAERRLLKRLSIYYGAGFGYLILPGVVYASIFGPISDDHMNWVIERFGEVWSIVILTVALIPAGILLFLGTWRMDERMAEYDSRLRCANCLASLLGTNVIMSGVCQKCGMVVLEVPSNSTNAPTVTVADSDSANTR